MTRLLKTLVLAAALPLVIGSTASAAIVLTKDVRGAATWDTFTVVTMPSSAPTTFQDVNENDTTGVGQSFTATATGNVDAISFGVTRMYANRDGIVNVYQMFGGDGVTPDASPTRFRNGNPDWMSDAIASIPFNTTAVNINNSGDGNNMYTFGLSGPDQFAVINGGTYMVQIAGNGPAGDDMVLLDRDNSSTYADGVYGLPNGGSTVTAVPGRDLMLAVNISPAAIPEPSSLALLGLGCVGVFARRRRRV